MRCRGESSQMICACVRASSRTPKTHLEMKRTRFSSAALLLSVFCAASEAPAWNAPEELPGLIEGDIIQVKLQNKRNLVADRHRLWPNKTVVFKFSNEYQVQEIQWIKLAMAYLQNQTCVTFKERTAKDKHYLHLRNKMGCASPVGFYPVGRVDMYLQLPNCIKLGTIQHEFLHALGFWHEHTRPDRDNHVSIKWQNVRAGAESNFFARKSSEAQFEQMPYDYDSVMHYSNIAFAKDPNKPTIVPFEKDAIIGQRKKVSKIDVAKLNRLYDCGPDFYQGDEFVQEGRPEMLNEIDFYSQV